VELPAQTPVEDVEPSPFVEAVPEGTAPEAPDTPAPDAPGTSRPVAPGPRPTGRRKRSGTPVPTTADDRATVRKAAEPRPGTSGGVVLPIVLVLVAAALKIFGELNKANMLTT
jgi:hypothetical protein